MIRILLGWVACVFCLYGAPVFAKPLVLTNGKIYTVDATRSWAQAVAIGDNGTIIAVGSQQAVLQQTGADVDVIDLQGRMVLPGFQDIHLHAVEAGINADVCLFDAFDTLSGYADTVFDCAQQSKENDWVVGANVNMVNLFGLHENPVEVLDEIVPDRPVLILDDIGHGAWANSIALGLAGYDTAQDQPNGNIILRNAMGEPNGVVLENAPHKLRSLAFPPTPENLDTAYTSLLQAAKTLNENGITSISDAGGYWPQGHHTVWDKAEQAGDLTLRASNAFYVYPDKPLEQQIATLRGLMHNDPNRLVRFNVAKIYVDGILSQATGALLAPYEAELELGPEDEHGYLYFEKATLMKAARLLSQAGFQLHFHVTGDYGTRLALDAIEQADAGSGPHRLTHIYLADPADFARFKQLDVIADFQLAPSALTQDYETFMRGFIGDRVKYLLPAGDLVKSGATVALSSDWDADELNPMVKIKAAVSRKNNGLPDVETAITALTTNPAKALRHADKTGSIEVGKFADLVILSDNILGMPLADIDTVTIDATLLQGEAVFDRNGIFAD